MSKMRPVGSRRPRYITRGVQDRPQIFKVTHVGYGPLGQTEWQDATGQAYNESETKNTVGDAYASIVSHLRFELRSRVDERRVSRNESRHFTAVLKKWLRTKPTVSA